MLVGRYFAIDFRLLMNAKLMAYKLLIADCIISILNYKLHRLFICMYFVYCCFLTPDWLSLIVFGWLSIPDFFIVFIKYYFKCIFNYSPHTWSESIVNIEVSMIDIDDIGRLLMYNVLVVELRIMIIIVVHIELLNIHQSSMIVHFWERIMNVEYQLFVNS